MKEKDILGKDLARELKAYGVSRRDFLKYCATTAAVLGLSEFEFTTKLAQALEKPTSGKPAVGFSNACASLVVNSNSERPSTAAVVAQYFRKSRLLTP